MLSVLVKLNLVEVTLVNVLYFQVYDSVTEHLYTEFYAHHPTSSPLPSPCIWPPSYLFVSLSTPPLVTTILLPVSMSLFAHWSLCLISHMSETVWFLPFPADLFHYHGTLKIHPGCLEWQHLIPSCG